jgi:hypothetical protein
MCMRVCEIENGIDIGQTKQVHARSPGFPRVAGDGDAAGRRRRRASRQLFQPGPPCAVSGWRGCLGWAAVSGSPIAHEVSARQTDLLQEHLPFCAAPRVKHVSACDRLLFAPPPAGLLLRFRGMPTMQPALPGLAGCLLCAGCRVASPFSSPASESHRYPRSFPIWSDSDSSMGSQVRGRRSLSSQLPKSSSAFDEMSGR